MNNNRTIHAALNYFIATVWIINGLFCKLLNFTPRHQLIVSRILGEDHSILFTKAIGVAEVCIALWILSYRKSRICAISQIAIVATMNIIEFFLASDLLLFGKMNALFAFIFISIIYYNEFVQNKKFASQSSL